MPEKKLGNSDRDPAPTDAEDASPGDTLFGGVSSGKGVDLPLRQAQGGGKGMLRPRHLQDITQTGA